MPDVVRDEDRGRALEALTPAEVELRALPQDVGLLAGLVDDGL